MEQNYQAGSLRDFLIVLFKHKSKILTIFLGTVATVTIGTFLLPPTYEATSSLMVKFGREYIYRPEVGENKDQRTTTAFNPEERINSEIEILTSQDLIEKVITTLQIAKIYPDIAEDPPGNMTPLAAARYTFAKKLSVEGVRKSNVITVAFQHKDPVIAAKAVNLLVDLFKEKHLQVFGDAQSSFFGNQLIKYEQQLQKSENNLESYRQKHKVFSLAEQRNLLLNQRSQLDTSLKEAQSRVSELQKKLSSLKNQMAVMAASKDLYTDTDRYNVIDDAKNKLLNLQLREKELLEKYKEDNELIKDVRGQIQLVNNFLKEQEEDIGRSVKTGNVVYQEAEKESLKTAAELSSQVAKAASTAEQLSQLDGEIQALDLREKELSDIKREVSTNEKNYTTYVEKAEEALISDELNRLKMANISVIQTATVPAKPVKPKKALNIILGMLLGACAGFGFAFFAEFTSQGLNTPEAAGQRLKLPILATVPHKG